MSDLSRWTRPVDSGPFSFRPTGPDDGIPSEIVVEVVHLREDGTEEVYEELVIPVDPTRVDR